MIGSTTIAGVGVLTIGSEADGGIEAAFAPSAGMVCPSLTHRGEQLLGQRRGLDGYVEQHSTMGIPLLHPWANRLERPRFRLAGEDVDVNLAVPPPKLDGHGLPMHGLLTAARGWSVEAHEDAGAAGGRLTASLAFGGTLAAGFPFPHTIAIEAELTGTTLEIRTTVRADAGSPVPIGFGFHPYLQLPGTPRADWHLSAPLAEQLALDESGLPTGQRHTVAGLHGPLGGRTYDDAYLAPAGGEPFVLSDATRRIALRFGDGYPFAQLYAPPGEQLLAIEPMTAPTNALVTGEDLTIIDPGDTYAAGFSITVSSG